MIRIIILGSGNVAQHLYTAFQAVADVQIVQCYHRKSTKFHKDQTFTETVDRLEDLIGADVYIVAVSDDAIGEVSKNLPFTERLVVHTSGSVPMDALSDRNRKGVFYPLQTFSKEREINYKEVPFCIEATRQEDLQFLKKLAITLSSKIYEISSAQRGILHIAAVFINNFTNHLLTTGKEVCNDHQLPFEIMFPLIRETMEKAIEIGPENAQTGPAKRNDRKTIKKHLDILKTDSQEALYNIFTKSIQSYYGKKL